MVEFLWSPLIATAAMIFGAVIAYALIFMSKRKAAQKPTDIKLNTYACGEVVKPEELHPNSEQFFSPVKRVVAPFYRIVQSAHSGVVSEYLLWVVGGLIVVFVVLLVILIYG
ncbi:MAG: hypothetical protein APU95_04390 [Hadesarchaea archaeon YNP_N21]|jgi:hypothetical protein|nr:MAG: hypothetical protein APU95_04390 [Hadesarchaea archaeon YNP_N21]